LQSDDIPVAEEIMAAEDREFREFLDWRNAIYHDLAKRLLRVKSQRDLLRVIQALELAALT
jgi:hypothetical protein